MYMYIYIIYHIDSTCRIWKRSKGMGPSKKKNVGRWNIKRSKPGRFRGICVVLGCNPGQPLLNWRPQDGSQEGIPTGIKVLGGVFGAGSGGSACDKNTASSAVATTQLLKEFLLQSDNTLMCFFQGRKVEVKKRI